MRTTVDISDDIFRKAKVHAAQTGVALKDLVERGLELVLREPPKKPGYRVKFPLIESKNPGALTNEMLEQIEAELDDEEAREIARVMRR